MRQGGSYRIDKEGDAPTLVARTEDHKDGNRARDAQGKPLDVLTDTAPAQAPKAKVTTSRNVKEKGHAGTT